MEKPATSARPNSRRSVVEFVMPRILLVAAIACTALPAPAQIGDLRLPISLDADSTDYDGKSSMLMFEGLRLSQGNIGVQADRGLAMFGERDHILALLDDCFAHFLFLLDVLIFRHSDVLGVRRSRGSEGISGSDGPDLFSPAP